MAACFSALVFVFGAKAVKSISRRENCFEVNSPPLFASNVWESTVGMLDNDGASLTSRFMPGTLGIVADLMREIALLGPRDILRRSRSSVKTRFRLWRGLAGTGRLVAAPGLDGAPEKLADLDNLGFGGDAMTGPPSLRLMAAHLSGRREEKLEGVIT
jgi:hypothetical protein